MSAARRARGAVAAVFFFNGLLFGSWAARIPAVSDRLSLSHGELGALAVAGLAPTTAARRAPAPASESAPEPATA